MAINAIRSACLDVTSGVPQGSHLGPLLFVLFLNDMGICFLDSNSMYSLYADDLKISTVINSPLDTVKLQADLNRFSEYCALNRLHLNVDKCNYIVFSRLSLSRNPNMDLSLNNIQLKRVNVVKDLGVTLDSKLLFEPHIEAIIRKALRNLGFILRTTEGL